MTDRKSLRLPGFDYSKTGTYFLTICVQDKKNILSSIVGVGVLDAPQVQLSEIGQTVKNQIEQINGIYRDLQITKYVIMPNHVHLMVEVRADGSSRTPTPTGEANAAIPRLISALKRFSNHACGKSLWQRSYYDHVVRDEADYRTKWDYIDENPAKWAEDVYYPEEIYQKGKDSKACCQAEPMKTVTIYTDGACSGNPGPGGWAAILEYQGQEKMLSGGAAQTTNNRMELTGVIEALSALREPCTVELFSDSKYVIDALEKGWAVGWRKRGWVKPDKKPALNAELWDKLLTLTETHTVHLHWVKGHAENEKNNRCDVEAVAQSQKFK